MSGLALQPTTDPGGNHLKGAEFYDECFSAPDTPRPHWDTLLTSLGRLGDKEIAARDENARRMLREQGVTCFVNTERGGTDEPWQLDLLPLIIAPEEWQRLEAGLIQRATLLNLVLSDLYGTQRLVRDGFIPAPLVFANPAYLRPCQGLAVKGNTYLMSYAADLVRSTDGTWWVIAERTQAPVGFGFAMQNRSVLSRVLPEVMRELQPRAIQEFLRVRHDALRHFSPGNTEVPAIALLTPGPRNEGYFEHAYLSRLLNLILVEGDDLTVRDLRVWVKTLSGLQPVHVVLRRVNDAFCDPLELRDDSLIGVPGLLEAARAGNVSIANSVGTGLVEAPAFMPFLPGLCRYLLGEDLQLPSPATWWCGQVGEQTYVREHIGELVVRHAFHASSPGLAKNASLLELLRRNPHEFVGQDQLRASRAPIMAGPQIKPRPFVLRTFLFHNGSEFLVMPGGLARALDETKINLAPASLYGLSKDVWVLPDPENASQLHQAISSPALRVEGTSPDVPSRTADNLFWLGRYTERLEEIVRSLRCALGCIGDDADSSSPARADAFQKLLSRLGLISPSSERITCDSLTQALLARIQGDEPAGLSDLLDRIHLAAFSVRDRLSADTWHLVNRLKTHSNPASGGLPVIEASSALHALLLDLAAFSGMEMENMTRGHGWVFLDLGRRIERAIFIAELIEALCESGSGVFWVIEPVLEIADSVMTHRRRYFFAPTLSTVLAVLAEDFSNPRSLAFQVACLQNHAAVLPAGSNPEGVNALRTLAGQIKDDLGRLSPEQQGSNAWAAETAPKVMHDIVSRLAAFSELLTEVYFSHVPPRVS